MSVVSLYQDFQRIHGFCPCCGEPFRLVDVGLHYKAPPAQTPWDALEAAWDRHFAAEERFEEDKERLREKAREAGRRDADRRLKTLTSAFRRSRICLNDIRVLFDPVDYVVFHGMYTEACKAIEFLNGEPASRAKERMQRSIDQALRAGNFSWITARIEDDGKILCT